MELLGYGVGARGRSIFKKSTYMIMASQIYRAGQHAGDLGKLMLQLNSEGCLEAKFSLLREDLSLFFFSQGLQLIG